MSDFNKFNLGEMKRILVRAGEVPLGLEVQQRRARKCLDRMVLDDVFLAGRNLQRGSLRWQAEKTEKQNRLR